MMKSQGSMDSNAEPRSMSGRTSGLDTEQRSITSGKSVGYRPFGTTQKTAKINHDEQGRDMQPTERNSLPATTHGEFAGNHGTDLRDSARILREGVLATMSLADESLKELNLHIKSVKSEKPTIEQIQTVAVCARTIAEIIKAKCEAMKFLVD